jgi:hypothetical protein
MSGFESPFCLSCPPVLVMEPLPKMVFAGFGQYSKASMMPSGTQNQYSIRTKGATMIVEETVNSKVEQR